MVTTPITIKMYFFYNTESDPATNDYHRSDEQTAIRMECYRYVTMDTTLLTANTFTLVDRCCGYIQETRQKCL